MRVGLIIYGLERPITGIGRYSLELSRALPLLREPIELFLLMAGETGPLVKTPGVRCIPLPGCGRLPALLTLGSLQMPQLARRYGLDILHDPTGVTPFACGAGPAHPVVTIHDVFPWSCPGNSSRLDDLIYRFWLPRILPGEKQHIITVSQHSRQDIQTYLGVNGERISVIPCGIGSQFKPLEPGFVESYLKNRFQISWPYVLFVGALTMRKNISRALQAFARVAPIFPDLHFVIAGPHSWKQAPVERMADRLQIGDRITLTGPVTDVDLPVLYNGAKLFVFPSLYEGFGLPPLEAMACGTPVVTSNVSSLPEVTGEAAILVDPGDESAIARAICQVLQDPALAADMKVRGVSQAAQFTWERTARATLAVYQNALRIAS